MVPATREETRVEDQGLVVNQKVARAKEFRSRFSGDFGNYLDKIDTSGINSFYDCMEEKLNPGQHIELIMSLDAQSLVVGKESFEKNLNGIMFTYNMNLFFEDDYIYIEDCPTAD